MTSKQAPRIGRMVLSVLLNLAAVAALPQGPVSFTPILPGASCTPTEVDLHGTKSGEAPVFTWTATAPWTVAGYSVMRSTSPADVLQGQPYAELPSSTTTFTDPDASAPLLFYQIVPSSTLLTLEWPGPFMDPPEAEQNDDGFKPTPVEPYLGAPEDVALSGDSAEFWVDVRSLLGCVPSAVELLVDRNDDGDYDDAGEVIPMARVAPDPPISADSLYFVRLDQPAAPGTPPGPYTSLYARDEAGNIRWAMADGAGTLTYRFRAWDGTAYATGPASADRTLTLLNTAKELVEELGIPVVESGAGGETTDWRTALTYFEEAEARVAPTSPFNQALEPERHPDYLNALLCAALSETAYTYSHYRTLFYDSPDKPYRDVALDWAAFAAKQRDRMNHLAAWAQGDTWPSAAGTRGSPQPAWQLDLPAFAWYFEGAAPPPFIFQGRGDSAARLFPPPANFVAPAFSPLETPSAGGQRVPFAADPVYEFPAAEWDRADAYLLKAYFQGIHAAAVLYRLYESPAASRLVTVADLDDIEVWLKPEDDAKAHAECDPAPCPPLNGIDDDGDGLVDDLGYTARLFEEFDGLGIYSADAANGFSLRSVADELGGLGTGPGTGGAMDSLRQAFRTMARETDDQTDDALLVYTDANGDHTFNFTDEWDYRTRAAGTDGLPDLQYGSGDLLPAGYCPLDPSAPEPVTIRGGMGEDLQWWIEQAVKAYNQAGGTTYDPACYPEVWGYTLIACDWGDTLERAVAGEHFNWRDDVENLLLQHGVDPADLGGDFQTFLAFLEDVHPAAFIDAPESIRGYLPYFCPTHTEPPCPGAQGYTFNGFFGDWDEPTDPIVPKKFWTIEPFSSFHWNGYGILDPACDPSALNTDPDCIEVGWQDTDGDGKYDLFEPLIMADASTPAHYLDLNGDGQWNGWTDKPHDRVSYGDGEGAGLYNFLYVYFQDPTFGGRLPGMTNESLNNYLGAAAGWGDGLLEKPTNQHPVNYHIAEEPPTAPGANVRFRITATDPDGDTLHFYLARPDLFAGAGGTVLVDGASTGIYELHVPSGTWGFVGVVYDNVNNLTDLAGTYVSVTR